MRSSKLFHDYYIASLTTTICKTLNHVRAYGVLVKCSLMCVPCISMNEDKSVFWVLFQQRKSYSVSFDRLYHLYPFIYPKYKHNKSLKLNQCRIFHLKISFPALSVAQKWQNSIFRSSNRVRFNENGRFLSPKLNEIGKTCQKWPDYWLKIGLEIENKNRFPVWAKLRQNVRFSDNFEPT